MVEAIRGHRGARLLGALVVAALVGLLVWLTWRESGAPLTSLKSATQAPDVHTGPPSAEAPANAIAGPVEGDARDPSATTRENGAVRDFTSSRVSSPAAPATTGAVPLTSAHATSGSHSSPGTPGDERRFPSEWRRCFRGSASVNQDYDLAADSSDAWSGSWSARISSRVDRPALPGAALCQTISASAFRGHRVRATMHLRTENAVPGAHLVFRADGGDGRVLALVDMDSQLAAGTTHWTGYSAVIDVPERASIIVLSGALAASGVLWIDDAAIDIVGRDVPLSKTRPTANVYFPVIDATGLSQALQNPGFEDTRPLRPGE